MTSGKIMAAMLIAGMFFWMPAARAAEDMRVEDLVIETHSGARHVFKVEIADTREKAARGLMFRTALPADHGMLFEFERPQMMAFWMKNTLIPLDILFVDEEGKIASIAEKAAPETTTPRASGAVVTGAVEINGGLCEKLGIAPGDRVVHPFFGQKP